MSEETWTSLEKFQLLVDVLTPLSVVLLGWFISRRLKRLDLIQFSNQKLIEKRLAVFDEIAPLLNDLYCFFRWRGNWRDISPADVIEGKRKLDKTVHTNRHLFDEEVFAAYRNFMTTLFEEHKGGPGRDARILSVIRRDAGDNRRKHGTYGWEESWFDAFSTPEKAANEKFVESRYNELMELLSESLGVERKKQKPAPSKTAARRVRH